MILGLLVFPMSEFVLDIKSLTRRFGAFTAVDGLTLSVNAGEVFALLGSNGRRPGTRHAAVLCQQRDLSHQHYARLAEGRFSFQSADLRRRCLRTFMLAGSTSTFGLGADYAVILATTIILVCIGAQLYPHLAT